MQRAARAENLAQVPRVPHLTSVIPELVSFGVRPWAGKNQRMADFINEIIHFAKA